MMKRPAISIITPVWNGLPYLKECIESVLNQEFRSWELLISDNGSTDGTREYLDTLTDPRVRVFKQKKNLGIMGNLNFLFSEARAPLCQILCADDYFLNEQSLGAIIRYWEKAPADLGFAGFNHQPLVSSPIIKLEQEAIPNYIPSSQADLMFFLFGNILGNLSNVTLRTHVVKETGYFDNNLPSAGDFDFWSRAARKYAMGMEKERNIFIRVHSGAASNYLSLKGETFIEKLKIYEDLMQRLVTSHGFSKLSAYFNCQISVMHYRLGIKSAIHGRFAYLKRFAGANSPILWPKWFLLSVCLPLTILNRKQTISTLMAKSLLKDSKRHGAPLSEVNYVPS